MSRRYLAVRVAFDFPNSSWTPDISRDVVRGFPGVGQVEIEAHRSAETSGSAEIRKIIFEIFDLLVGLKSKIESPVQKYSMIVLHQRPEKGQILIEFHQRFFGSSRSLPKS